MEHRSAELSHRLASMLDVMDEGLQIIDHNWRYLYVNEAAATHGQRPREALIGRSMLELYPGIETTEMFGHLERCMRDGVPHRMDNEFTFPDGTKHWFELRIDQVPEGVRILSIDVGQRRELELQLAHAQKMEAVGQLAGGIAHDFNNLLTIIMSYASFALEGLAPETQPAGDIQEAINAATRGAKLTRQLLALSRRQMSERKVVSAAECVRALTPMFQRVLGERIEVLEAIDPDAGAIRVDPGQLDQVLLNLVSNARDAMPTGGRIQLRVQNVTLDTAYADSHSQVDAGNYVMISVADNGIGMDAATQRRIFEPFFTTKGPERGTGLGLATSHGIVRQHGGYIWVYSEPGRGTTFKLYFPRVFGALDQAESASRPPNNDELRGDEVVLVVEDEPSLRAMCSRVLKHYGYTVIHARNGDEALRFAESYSGPIDAVLTDVMMPGITGPEVVQKLRQSRTDLTVLYMSGYADHDLIELIDPGHYLEKPFGPDALVRKLRQLLPRKP